ncbi:MAG: diguanylate cyclase [Lachnospiraceae bacterium]|nr:diguanylate cyclase [Lachnospiraceae bacterium]
MKKYNEKLGELSRNFYDATNVSVMCFDIHLNMVTCYPTKLHTPDISYLGINMITNLLTDFFSNPIVPNANYYTCFLDYNLTCSIYLLVNDGRYIGALVTELVLVNKLSSLELKHLINQPHLSTKDRKKLSMILYNTPIIPYQRVLAIGKVLACLAEDAFSNMPITNSLIGGNDNSSAFSIDFSQKNSTSFGAINPYKHSSFATYLQIKESIQNGDLGLLNDILDNISSDNIPLDQLHNSNFIRSLKNYFIRTCSMYCYVAIDANGPFDELMNLSDDFICQIESLHNINDIYDTTKKSLVAFTRIVSINNKRNHSKAIRQVLEYIQTHFFEKITLEHLATHTQLSTFYLSNLIKKETGLVLTDNINKFRIEKSKEFLLHTNLSILEISHHVGFNYQNHFASVFKKFTGFSPSEFRKTLGKNAFSNQNLPFLDEALPLISEEIRNKLSLFPYLYDMVRIIDPISHSSWMLQSNGEKSMPEPCYKLWNKKKSCKDCIAMKAYLENDAIFKVECQKEITYLIFATPIVLDKKAYVVEAFRDITNRIFIDKKLITMQHMTSQNTPSTAAYLDELTSLYNRSYINKQLPINIRQSKLEHVPLSILIIALDDLSFVNEHYDYAIGNQILRTYAHAISSSLPNCDGWAGRYTGSIFLLAITNKTSNQMHEIYRNIEVHLSKNIIPFKHSKIDFTVSYGVNTLTNDIVDTKSFIGLTFMNLHTKTIHL